MLDDAGYPKDGNGVRMKGVLDLIPYGEDWRRGGEYLKQALGDIGIELELRYEDVPTWLKRIYHNYDFQMNLNYFYQLADPVLGVHRHYGTNMIRKGTHFVNSSRYSNPELDKLLRAGIIPFAIFFVMTGLFIMGIASLVECSAVGALAATLAAWSKGRLNLKVIEDVCKKTLGVSCMFMWIILAALSFGAVFDGIGATKAIESLFIERWNLSPWGVLIMMQLSYILMGMFLDDTAMLVIVAPLYVPLIIALGFDPIWYGVLYTITCQIAYMTPPFGYNLFLMRAMAPKEITLIDIYRSIIPFVLVMLFGLIIMMRFPQIALWLPTTILG